MLLVEDLLLLLLALALLTQLVIPIARNRPTWPLLRRNPKLREAERELDAVVSDLEVRDVKAEADRLRDTAQEKRSDDDGNSTAETTTTKQAPAPQGAGKPKAV